MQITLIKKPLDFPITKTFNDILYPDYLAKPVVFGAFKNQELLGVLELNYETWNNLLRITELLVFPDYRQQGIGSLLMDKAKEVFRQSEARMLILETQNLNVPTITFYLKSGFVFNGLDLTCYSNDDVNEKDVRLEFAYFKA